MSRHFQGNDTLIARVNLWRYLVHYNDVIMASLITGVSIACLTVCSGGDQRKHQTPRHWPLCGEFTGDRGIQKASNTENVSISWRHHESRSTIILYGGDMETCLLAPTAGLMPIMSSYLQLATIVHGQDRLLVHHPHILNTLRPRQNGRHFTDDIFKCIFLYENIWISLKFVPKDPVNNIPALV